MSDDDRTLASYDAAADRYAAAQGDEPVAEVLAVMDRMRAAVDDGAAVLEIGAGTGQDARLLAARGLAVTPTDATPAFVAMMRAGGLPAYRLDVRHDPLGGPWDGVWANAVLLHLSPAELAAVLDRLRDALRPGGMLVFTVKEGDGEGWSTAKLDLPRHFTYWREESLRPLLAAWRDVTITPSTGRVEDWLAVTARR